MIYAIGDIHGRSDMLSRALHEINKHLAPTDTVVFLGDYIDRGPDSCCVLDMVMGLRSEHANTICLRGNHEQMLLDAYTHGYENLWLENGGHETLKSYGTFFSPWSNAWRGSIHKEHLDFMASALLEWDSERFHFVHAGLVPPSQRDRGGQVKSDLLHSPEPRLWIRSEFIDSPEDFGKFVVFGHTVQKSWQPLIMDNKMGIDTGATFGGNLTVAVLDDETGDFSYFQVDQALTIPQLPEEDESHE